MTRTAGLRGVTQGQIIRFLIVGGTNTLLTYALFVGLGLLVQAWIAYTIAFVLGLAWTVVGSSRLVFRAEFSLRRMLLFMTWYLGLYGIGQLVIHLVKPTGISGLLVASLIVLVITTPLTFVGGRLIFGSRRSDPIQATEGELPK